MGEGFHLVMSRNNVEESRVPKDDLFSCTVNGVDIELEVLPTLRLIDILRESLRLTGTKIACEIGRCGACLVLVDGQPTNACLMMAYQAQGRHIETIEGVSPDIRTAVQAAFLQEGALQCGYCTPGMIMATCALLQQNPHPNTEQVKEALVGNLCRCTGYSSILRAVDELQSGGINR